jgi:hypothetical protein
MEGQVTMFSPLKALERKNGCWPDLNLILSTFLKATSTISTLPYLADLVDLNKNKITLS